MPHLPCGPGFSRPTHRVRLKPDLHGARRVFAVAATFLALAHAAHADPAPAAQAEIDHLLAFVAASSCSFIRSGKPYPAAEARDHLAGKFQYAKSRISTADQFIRYIASESSMTREPYKVKCGASEMPAGVWLTAELQRYRAAATRPAR
ncbi:MAG TPA: DUF5329 domain-containing protein [Casimicrobiaceae bacterium]